MHGQGITPKQNKCRRLDHTDRNGHYTKAPTRTHKLSSAVVQQGLYDNYQCTQLATWMCQTQEQRNNDRNMYKYTQIHSTHIKCSLYRLTIARHHRAILKRTFHIWLTKPFTYTSWIRHVDPTCTPKQIVRKCVIGLTANSGTHLEVV